MLGIDTRAARITWTVALVLLALYLVYLSRSTLFLFILAMLFAYFMSPLVNLIDRLLPASRTRKLALALAYILLVGIVVGAAILLGSKVVDEANQLAKVFPQKVDALSASFDRYVPDSLKTELTTRSAALVGSLPQAGIHFLAFASNLIYLFIIPVLAFFFLKDGAAIREHLLSFVDAGPRHDLFEKVFDDIHEVLANYTRALAMLALGAFCAYSIFLAVLRVPYAILLGTLAGVLEFIPILGPLVAAGVILVATAVSGASVIPILIFAGGFRLFQDYVASPHVMGQGMELHPLLVLFGVFAGAEVSGVPGAFLSVPLLAVVRVLYLRLREKHIATRLTA